MSEESAKRRHLLGSFIRAQRQIWSGGFRALGSGVKSIAQALNRSAEALLHRLLLNTRVDRARRRCNENRTAGELPNSPSRKRALLAVYRSYVEANGHGLMDNVADGLISPTR